MKSLSVLVIECFSDNKYYSWQCIEFIRFIIHIRRPIHNESHIMAERRAFHGMLVLLFLCVIFGLIIQNTIYNIIYEEKRMMLKFAVSIASCRFLQNIHITLKIQNRFFLFSKIKANNTNTTNSCDLIYIAIAFYYIRSSKPFVLPG